MISIFMLFTLIISVVPVYALPEENLSNRVIVTDFKFISGNSEITSVPVNSTIYAEFYIERTEVGSGKQSFIAFLQMFEGGRLKKITSQKGNVSVNGGKVKCTLPPVTTSTDVSDTSINVVILSDGNSLVPLAPSANLSSNDCRIKAITVGDKKIELKKDEYNYSVDC